AGCDGHRLRIHPGLALDSRGGRVHVAANRRPLPGSRNGAVADRSRPGNVAPASLLPSVQAVMAGVGGTTVPTPIRDASGTAVDTLLPGDYKQPKLARGRTMSFHHHHHDIPNR